MCERKTKLQPCKSKMQKPDNKKPIKNSLLWRSGLLIGKRRHLSHQLIGLHNNLLHPSRNSRTGNQRNFKIFWSKKTSGLRNNSNGTTLQPDTGRWQKSEEKPWHLSAEGMKMIILPPSHLKLCHPGKWQKDGPPESISPTMPCCLLHKPALQIWTKGQITREMTRLVSSKVSHKVYTTNIWTTQ